MPALTIARRLAAAGLVALTIAIPAACAGSAAPAFESPPSAASPAPSDPGPAIDTDALLRDGSREGKVVRVSGFFVATGGTARLCSVVLESYPPQCGAGTVRITGEVPAAVLSALESTSDPALARATWGQVEVTGVFRGSDLDGQPSIEITSIEVIPPIKG